MSQPSDQDRTDLVLVERCQQGQVEYFGDLVARYQSRIYNMAYRILHNREEAEDITQETFLNVYRALDSFKGDRFSPWIYKIASNLCLDYLRRRRPSVVSLDAPVGPDGDITREMADETRSPEDAALADALGSHVQRAIDSLPPKYRAVVVLRHMQDLAYEEIADALGLPLGTVKTRLFRAREILRVRLAERV
ncbi:MAG: sigma-70 family RNA polymerase sigma factor [Bacillota bacterium]|nr:MAG: sigma-70 family RNA polymerase sigma factor [Bacillota bacterium]